MKTICIFVVLFCSVGFSQSPINDRFDGFDPFVTNIITNIFNDMNIITTDCPAGVAEGMVFAPNALSSGVVCGSISFGDALGLFTSSWNRAFDTHTQGWEAMSPWDSTVGGDLQTVNRAYTYIGMSEVYSLMVIYVSNGLVIITSESLAYTP